MSEFASKLEIEMAINKCHDTMTALSIIRNHISVPVLTLKENIESGKTFSLFTLEKANYFDGWKVAFQLAEELIEKEFDLKLTVNGEAHDLTFLYDLRSKVTNISKQDIY